MQKETIREVQQRLAEYSGHKNDVIWDRINEKQTNILEAKINQLYPDQKNSKEQNIIKQMRSTLFDNVWAQRKYTSGYLLSSIFYVACTHENDLTSKQYSLHPVFRTQKCSVEGDGADTTDCCMIYIDEVGRIYENWDSYINENVLPPGNMILPPRGVYNFDEHNKVKLCKVVTPSNRPGPQTVETCNKALSLACIPATVVQVSALAFPVTAPLVLCSSIITGAAAVVGTISSGSNLFDRHKHGQSVSLLDTQARNNWFNIASGVVGISLMSTTRTMKSMATAGKTTTKLEMAVNTLNVASIATSSGGVINSLVYLLKKKEDDEPISWTDITQMATSLVLFTHSIYNFQLASSIADDARTGRINDYRKSLSNRQRKMFEKLSKETIRIRGNVKGKMDIIRNVNDMPNVQYLNDLNKINKQLNQNKVRPSFASGNSKGITLNDQVNVDTNSLRKSLQYGVDPDVLKRITNPIPKTNSSGNKIYFADTTKANTFYVGQSNPSTINPVHLDLLLNEGIVIVTDTFKIALRAYGTKFCQRILDLESFSECIKNAYKMCEKDILYCILKISKTFIDEFADEFKSIISTDSVFSLAFNLWREFHRSSFNVDTMLEIISKLYEYYKSQEPKQLGVKHKCAVCPGFYRITQLQ